MKLRPKFALLFIGAAAFPLAIAGYSSARISQSTLRHTIEQNELTAARQVAEYVASRLENLHATLTLETRILDLSSRDAPPPEELLRKFLQLIYHQNDDFSVVGIFAEDGQPVARAAYQESPRPGSAFGNHHAIPAGDAAALGRLTPLAQAMQVGAAVGAVYLAGTPRVPHIVLAVRYDPQPGAAPRIIAAAVSLRRITSYLAGVANVDTDVLLLDRRGRLVASGRRPGPGALAPKELPGAPAGALPPREFVAQYDSDGRHVIGAYAPAAAYGLGVVVERRLEAVLSPVRRLGWATIYWIGVSAVVAAVVGAALARTLASRVAALAEGAGNVARGRLDTKLEVQSSDELGELARAFNAMGTSLDAARTEILRQTEEIKAWNETLERRVEEKSKELRAAQDLLLRSRSLAAIGSLGAGVAHEINNPLTGVLGLAQLLLADMTSDHPARTMVKDIEEQAVRIQGIVSNLLRLSQQQAGEDFRPLDLSRVIDDALELCGLKSVIGAADSPLRVTRRVTSPSPPIRGAAAQLQAALIQLVENARGAMADSGGELTIETSMPDENLLRLRISDTGRGIKPDVLPRIFDPFFTTKARRTDTGIGLSVVHKIIEDHGGSIRVESEVGQGTTFWLTFPVDAGASHLA